MNLPSEFREGRLFVVGNINRDVKTSPLPERVDVSRDGETNLEFIAETIGGGGANAACAAAALGGQVGFAGLVGEDPLGEALGQALTRWGVQSFLKRSQNVTTGSTLVLVHADGHRHFLSSHPNNRRLSFVDLDLSGLKNFRHLLRADIWFSEAMLYGGNERLFREARAHGLEVSMDINWDPHWGMAEENEISRRKAALRQVLSWVDYAHGNTRELCAFTGESTLARAAESLIRSGVKGVVAHLGAEGSGYFNESGWIKVPASAVTSLKQTTGCGDVLSTCWMLLQDAPWPMAKKLEIANEVVAEFMEGRLELFPRL